MKTLLVVLVALVVLLSAAAVSYLSGPMVVELPEGWENHADMSGWMRKISSSSFVQQLMPRVIMVVPPDSPFLPGSNFTPSAGKLSEAQEQYIGQLRENTLRESTCKELSLSKEKDRCYFLLSRQTNNTEHCAFIGSNSKKDTCYLNFIIGKEFFDERYNETCEKILDDALRSYCFSINRMNSFKNK